MRITLFVLILFFGMATNAPAFDYNETEAMKATNAFKKKIEKSLPIVKGKISGMKADSDDGHLTVKVNNGFNELKKSERQLVFKTLVALWKITPEVKKKNYGGWVSVGLWDYAKLEMIDLGTFK